MNCNHEHGCCGHNHNAEQEHKCGGCKRSDQPIGLSELEAEFLMCLAQIPFLPLTRFVMKSTRSEHYQSVALAPVFMNNAEDSMETVKETGEVLKSLEEKGLITLDYDQPLERGDYSLYETSQLYKYFVQTVDEGKLLKDSLFDKAVLELGSIALTMFGQAAVEQLDIK